MGGASGRVWIGGVIGESGRVWAGKAVGYGEWEMGSGGEWQGMGDGERQGQVAESFTKFAV